MTKNMFDTVARMRMPNEDFGIRLFIEQGPNNMLVREFMLNCIQAFQHPGETARQIFVRGVQVPGYAGRKLSFLNTCVGLDTETLAEITDLTGSQKKLGTESRANRGQGAKIAGCKYNPLGILFRTRKNGVVSRAALGWCEATKQWGRAEVEINDTTHESWVQALSQSEAPYYAYKGFTGDFFEVIMLGRTPEQDTFANPYGVKTKPEDDNILNEITTRFFRLPKTDLTIPTRITYQPSPKDIVEVQMSGDLVEFPEEILDTRSRMFKRERLPLVGGPAGVEVEFIQGLNHAGRKAFPARCAIVFEDEQYDVRMRDRWQNASLNFGVIGMAGKLSVLLHFPDRSLTADLYRQNLMDADGQPVTTDSFATQVYASRPKWVLDLQASVKMASDKDMKESVENYLETLLARKALEREQAQMMADKKKSGNSGTPNPDSIREPRESNPAATEEVRAVADPKEGTLRPKLAVPTFAWLTNPTPDLRHRTVQYASQAGDGGTLYLNTTSKMISNFVDMILQSEGGNRENVREFIRHEVQHHITVRVAQVIIYQRFIKGTDSWKEGDVADSLSLSALNALVASLDYDFREYVGPRLRGCRKYQRLLAGGLSEADDESIFKMEA